MEILSMLRVTIKRKDLVLSDFTIKKGESLVVGRDPNSNVCLDDAQISRRHARLTYGSRGLTVADLGSANGTFVNGAKVQEMILEDKDVLKLADFTLSWEIATPVVARWQKLAGAKLSIPELSGWQMLFITIGVVFVFVLILTLGGKDSQSVNSQKSKSVVPPEAGQSLHGTETGQEPHAQTIRPREKVSGDGQSWSVTAEDSRRSPEGKPTRQNATTKRKRKTKIRNRGTGKSGAIEKSIPGATKAVKLSKRSPSRSRANRFHAGGNGSKHVKGSSQSSLGAKGFFPSRRRGNGSQTGQRNEKQDNIPTRQSRPALSAGQKQQARDLYYEAYQIMAYKTKERYLVARKLFERVKEIAPDPQFEFYQKATQKIRAIQASLDSM